MGKTTNHHLFPTLFAKSSTGKIKVYTVQVKENPDGTASIWKTFGYKDSNLQTIEKIIKVGKNLGKTNETTPYQQAVLEATADWNKKIDAKYLESLEGLNTVTTFLPMLAHKWIERKHNIEYPAYVQPKLNGCRCIYNNGSYTSRQGKEFTTLTHLDQFTTYLSEQLGYPLDGELFNPQLSFQEIVRLVKKDRGLGGQNPLQYWVYDLVAKDLTFEQRYNLLKRTFVNFKKHFPSSPIVLVDTLLVNTEEEIMTNHQVFSQNYEGTIIRNKNGLYKCDFRSNDLLKLKDFVDEEFQIIGGKEGTGLEEGCVVFTCLSKNGQSFDVRPRGARELRKEWFNNLDTIVKKKTLLTVKYQNLSEDGTPIFPVGVTLRDYE